MDIDKVKDKVRKLLAVAANDAAQGNEIENALKAARTLMQAYHLEEGEIGEGETEKPLEFDKAERAFTGSRVVQWECLLANFVCKFIGGVSWYRHKTTQLRSGRMQQVGCAVFYGPEEEVALAVEMQEALTTTIIMLARAKYNSWARSNGATYAQGFVAGLQLQLTDADKESSASTTGNALVVQSAAITLRKRQLAAEWLSEKQGIRLRSGSRLGGSRGSGDARNSGQSDGKNFDLSGLGRKSAKIGQTRQIGNS